MEPANSGGLLTSLRQLLGTLLEIAQVRLDLISTELELEKRRWFDTLWLGALALVCIALGLVLLCGTLLLLFWEGYRLAAASGLTLLFLGTGALLLAQARQRLQQPGGMFSASARELRRDREADTPPTSRNTP
jgi:uncharacterized membrane protein YqjE